MSYRNFILLWTVITAFVIGSLTVSAMHVIEETNNKGNYNVTANR
jgi:hypothetical protein